MTDDIYLHAIELKHGVWQLRGDKGYINLNMSNEYSLTEAVQHAREIIEEKEAKELFS